MKKAITTIFAVLLTINTFAMDVWDGTASPWTNGSGTSNDPYLIETAENLAYLAEKVNEGYQAQGMAVFAGQFFLLTDDLDLNNINWTPIGNVNMNMQGYYFAGIFDGWYHNIDHLKIQSNADVCGLFAGLGGDSGGSQYTWGEIRYLSVTNGNITSTGTGVGGIVGGMANEAFVYQCSFSGTISVSNGGSYCGAGGIVAAAAQNSKIYECSFHGSITATNNGGFTGAAGAGGIVGIAMDDTSILSCYNTGNITASSFMLNVAAGIVGATLQENSVTVKNCYNVGTVNASTKGGIFGMISPINPTKNETDIEVFNCYYLNTCGGTTNYGTSKTSAEMQTEDFLFLLTGGFRTFIMDNGTNNGYPIHSLANIKLMDATDITYHSAKISADIHEGNDDFVRAVFVYNEWNENGNGDEIEIEVEIADHVEVILEDLNPETFYLYYMYCEFADGTVMESQHYSFSTTFDGISDIPTNEIQIYPNPTSDFIYIENTEPQSIFIYSLDGKLIKTIENANVVDVRDLENGMYLININGKTKRIVID
ncbi:MAG: T9SS type A sorting domain-containing protein [Bacteroidales bacterium]|nr:T9SS type A sorting domain-containing protein [Bacteroidales bacterium]